MGLTAPVSSACGQARLLRDTELARGVVILEADCSLAMFKLLMGEVVPQGKDLSAESLKDRWFKFLGMKITPNDSPAMPETGFWPTRVTRTKPQADQ